MGRKKQVTSWAGNIVVRKTIVSDGWIVLPTQCQV